MWNAGDYRGMARFDVDEWTVDTDEEGLLRVSGPGGWVIADVSESVSSPGVDARVTVAAGGEVVVHERIVNDVSRSELWLVLADEAETVRAGGYD